MIVMFRGGGQTSNMAPQALALYAAVNSIIYNRKTIVFQFTKNTPIEKILRGKQDGEEELGHSQFSFDDTGIDSLLRRTETRRFEKEYFDISCKHMSKAENQFDVVGASKKDDFEREILIKNENVEKIIKEATKVYDDVYILGNGADGAQMSLLNKIVELSIICVSQGEREEVQEAESVKSDGEINKVLYMVTDFDTRSAYDVTRLKKEYGVKEIAILPYCTAFKDAYNSQTMLSFVINNTAVKDTDVNYYLFSKVIEVQKVMMGQEEPMDKEIDLSRLNRIEDPPEEEEQAELRTLTAKNVRYTKKYEKHLFGSREIDEYEVDMDHFSDEEDGDPDEFEELEEENADGAIPVPDGEIEEWSEQEDDEFELDEIEDEPRTAAATSFPMPDNAEIDTEEYEEDGGTDNRLPAPDTAEQIDNVSEPEEFDLDEIQDDDAEDMPIPNDISDDTWSWEEDDDEPSLLEMEAVEDENVDEFITSDEAPASDGMDELEEMLNNALPKNKKRSRKAKAEDTEGEEEPKKKRGLFGFRKK